jgi:hypothetical protein
VIPPSLDGADTTRQGYGYDPDRARELLREAGYPDGIDIELWHSQTSTASRLAQTIQGYLHVAGIRAKLVQRDAPSMREAAWKGETDLVLKDWWADYPDAENFLYPLLHSANVGPGGNVSFWANPTFDQLVARARREQREDVRTRLYTQADSLAYSQAPMLFLFFASELYALQPWLQGFQVPVIFNGQRWVDATLGGGSIPDDGEPPPAVLPSPTTSRLPADSSAASEQPARDTLVPPPAAAPRRPDTATTPPAVTPRPDTSIRTPPPPDTSPRAPIRPTSPDSVTRPLPVPPPNDTSIRPPPVTPPPPPPR